MIAIPISSGKACGLSIGSKVIYELIIKKYNKYKKQYEKYQQIINSFDKYYRKILQDTLIDEKECESLCNAFTEYLEETKNESVL